MRSAKWQMNLKNTIEKNAIGTGEKARNEWASAPPMSSPPDRTNETPKFRLRTPVVRRFLSGVLLLLLLLGRTRLSAQTNTTPKRLPNRYLVVVETSHAMDKRGAAVTQVLRQLLLSGMNGQLRSGDSLGLWTFNDDLHGGEFPLQEWSPQDKTNITAAVVTFIEHQKFGKTGHLSSVLPEMARLSRVSDLITFVLICSGTENVVGTPFDAKINQSFITWRDQQAKAHQPFVTVLRANRGRLTDFTIAQAPWPIEMPPLPAPPPAAAQPVIASTAKPAAPTVAPLIVSGRKTNVAVAPSPSLESPSQPTAIAPVPLAATNASQSISAANASSRTNESGASSLVADSPSSSPITLARPAKPLAGTQEVSSTSSAPSAGQATAVPDRDASALPVFARTLVPDGPETNSEASAGSPVVAVQSPRLNTVSYQKRFWLFGAAGFGTVAGIILLFLSRSRHRTGPSFITHSMNRRGGAL
jgi:hypothetical protein